MPSRAGLDFKDMGIAEVLQPSGAKRLRVPPNQRDYSWKTEHVERLYGDIGDAIAGKKPVYFLGTVVLDISEPRIPKIVDGQQRLATTTILLAAMRDYMLAKHEPFAKSLEDDYLFIFDRNEREKVPRLTMNVDDNEYFRKRVLLRPDSKERKALKPPSRPSHQRISAAVEVATDHIEQIVGSGEPETRLNQWINYLAESAVVIALQAPDDMNAWKMFETLNDRGLRATQADMLKNYLFEQAADRLPEAQRKWSAVLTSLESLDIEDVLLAYLRHATLVKFGITKERLGFYERIKKEVKGKTNAVEFLDDLAKYADDYAAILTPTHKKWNEYPGKITSSIAAMRELGVAQIRPLMLAAASHLSEREAEKAFRAFVCWTARFLIVGGMRGQQLEDAYAERAFEIGTGAIASAKALRDRMTQIVPKDSEFKLEFATASVSKTVLARYYLRALEARKREESDYPELTPIEDKEILNLEHILPQTTGPGWSHISDDDADALCNRIGNLALLNAKRNSLIGNAPFKTKREAFGKSELSLTKAIHATTKPATKWGKKEIEDRQRVLAGLALETWPV